MSRFVSDNTPLKPGQFRRPSGGVGGRPSGAAVGGRPNTALNKTSMAPGFTPRTVSDVPRRSVGVESNDNTSIRTQTSPLGRQNAGMGGNSAAAMNIIRNMLPSGATQPLLPHTKPTPLSHDRARAEQGVPPMAGFGDKRDPFTRNIAPSSTIMGGMTFAGFPSRPTKLDSQPGLGAPKGNGDPRMPNATMADAVRSGVSPFMQQSFLQAREAGDTMQTNEGDVVNATIPYRHVVRPLQANFKHPREFKGMIMCLFRGVLAFNSRESDAYKNEIARRMAAGAAGAVTPIAESVRMVEFTLTYMNFFLANAKDTQSPDEWTERMKLWTLLDKYAVQGVAIGDDGGLKRSRDAAAMPDAAVTHYGERGVNTCVQGQTLACNIWRPDACAQGVRLYLIPKRVARVDLQHAVQERYAFYDDHAATNNEAVASFVLTPEAEITQVVKSAEMHPYPFQLVPYAHYGGSTLPDDVLEYTDGANVYRSQPILVGVAHYPQSYQNGDRAVRGDFSAATNAYLDALRSRTNTVEEIAVARRKMEMLKSLSLANNARAQVKAGQIQIFVNVHVLADA